LVYRPLSARSDKRFLTTAVFVMEIGLDNRFPTYSGGLGILAGDMAYSFSDLGIPAAFVTLMSRNGYNSQKLDPASGQLDSPQPWNWQEYLAKSGVKVEVEIGSGTAKVGSWEYRIKGRSETLVLFLDTGFPENPPEVREATDRLYGGGPNVRLIQDMILGVGGYRVLKALGIDVQTYHLNESHAGFATVELVHDLGDSGEARRRCVFTTHTPIPAGNDAFPLNAVKEAFKRHPAFDWDAESTDGTVSLSKLASKYSGVTNAVSLKHRFVSNGVLGHGKIAYVTNGVYHRRWVHPEVKVVFDRYLPGWEDSPSLLARAAAIPSADLDGAHRSVKEALVREVNGRSGAGFTAAGIVITVAKRFTSYKRNGMILSDPERLSRIASQMGEVQVILAGKAHPMDGPAKGMLQDAIQKAIRLKGYGGRVRVAVLENYDIELAKLLVAGSDVWLNNPRRPLEACGTSGMKAGMNGVLNLSVYDGWWLEAGVDGVNGWGIGRRTEWSDISGPADGEDENDLYRKLSEDVLPLYYGHRDRWMEMAKSSIATAGGHFNSYRMTEDYVTKVYSLALAGT
jgi:glycogen phosphorylase